MSARELAAIAALAALDELAVFTLDGEPTTLLAVVEANEGWFTADELERIASLQPGESLPLGGGASPDFTLARVR